MIILGMAQISFDCNRCHDVDLDLKQEDVTWGYYNREIGFSCDECKLECLKDEKCGGIECYENFPRKSKAGLASCLWRARKISDECIPQTQPDRSDRLTCWKKTAGKFR